MTKTKKALALAMCAVLLVVSTVFVTMAYLTSTTEVVKNTFTVGNVTITLDEAKVTEYGVEEANEDRVTENEYKLIPGHEYVKDPTIHVDANSEDCYLFVKVENGIEDIEDASATIASQMAAKGWTLVGDETNVYAYKETVQAEEDVVVFETFTISGTADVSGYVTETNANAKINITAYAVQADGFEGETAEYIWDTAF